MFHLVMWRACGCVGAGNEVEARRWTVVDSNIISFCWQCCCCRCCCCCCCYGDDGEVGWLF